MPTATSTRTATTRKLTDPNAITTLPSVGTAAPQPLAGAPMNGETATRPLSATGQTYVDAPGYGYQPDAPPQVDPTVPPTLPSVDDPNAPPSPVAPTPPTPPAQTPQTPTTPPNASEMLPSSLPPVPPPAAVQPPPQAAPDEMADLTRQATIQLLRTPQTVDAESLRSDPAVQAFRLTAQRTAEQEARDLAERGQVEGWSSSGGQAGQLAQIRERQGTSEAQFTGQRAVDLLNRRRDQLLQGIQFAMSSQQFDKAQALQRELAATEADLRRYGIASSEQTTNDRLGFDYAALQAQMNRDATILALQGGL